MTEDRIQKSKVKESGVVDLREEAMPAREATVADGGLASLKLPKLPKAPSTTYANTALLVKVATALHQAEDILKHRLINVVERCGNSQISTEVQEKHFDQKVEVATQALWELNRGVPRLIGGLGVINTLSAGRHESPIFITNYLLLSRNLGRIANGVGKSEHAVNSCAVAGAAIFEKLAPEDLVDDRGGSKNTIRSFLLAEEGGRLRDLFTQVIDKVSRVAGFAAELESELVLVEESRQCSRDVGGERAHRYAKELVEIRELATLPQDPFDEFRALEIEVFKFLPERHKAFSSEASASAKMPDALAVSVFPEIKAIAPMKENTCFQKLLRKVVAHRQHSEPLEKRLARVSASAPVVKELALWESVVLDKFADIGNSIAVSIKSEDARADAKELEVRCQNLMEQFKSIDLPDSITKQVSELFDPELLQELADKLKSVCNAEATSEVAVKELIRLYSELVPEKSNEKAENLQLLDSFPFGSDGACSSQLAFHYADYHKSWKEASQLSKSHYSQYWRDQAGTHLEETTTKEEVEKLNIAGVESSFITFTVPGYGEQIMELPFRTVSSESWDDYLEVGHFGLEVVKLQRFTESLARLEKDIAGLVEESNLSPLCPEILVGGDIVPFISEIVDIEESLYRAPGDPDIEELGVVLQLDDWQGNKELFDEGARLAAIVKDGKLMAYCTYYEHIPDWFKLNDDHDPLTTGVIVMMYVSPELAEQGGASALFQTIVNDVQRAGVTGLIGHVEHTNARAISFWQKQGWVVQGEHVSSKAAAKTKGGRFTGYYLDMYFDCAPKGSASTDASPRKGLTTQFEVELGRRRHFQNNLASQTVLTDEVELLRGMNGGEHSVCLAFDDSEAEFNEHVMQAEKGDSCFRLVCASQSFSDGERRVAKSDPQQLMVRVSGAGNSGALGERLERCRLAREFGRKDGQESFLVLDRNAQASGVVLAEAVEWLNSGLDVVLVGEERGELEDFIAAGKASAALNFQDSGRILSIQSWKDSQAQLGSFINGGYSKVTELPVFLEALTTFREGGESRQELRLETRLLAAAEAISLGMNHESTWSKEGAKIAQRANFDLDRKQLDALDKTIGIVYKRERGRGVVLEKIDSVKAINTLLKVDLSEFPFIAGGDDSSVLANFPHVRLVRSKSSPERTGVLALRHVAFFAEEFFYEAFSEDMQMFVNRTLRENPQMVESSDPVPSWNEQRGAMWRQGSWPEASGAKDFIFVLARLPQAERQRLAALGHEMKKLVLIAQICKQSLSQTREKF